MPYEKCRCLSRSTCEPRCTARASDSGGAQVQIKTEPLRLVASTSRRGDTSPLPANDSLTKSAELHRGASLSALEWSNRSGGSLLRTPSPAAAALSPGTQLSQRKLTMNSGRGLQKQQQQTPLSAMGSAAHDTLALDTLEQTAADAQQRPRSCRIRRDKVRAAACESE
jgi:hypothetical protein